MKVLWVCNILPPLVADKLNIAGSNKEGWITGALMRMSETGVNGSISELAIAYPVNDINKQARADTKLDNGFKVTCFGYYEDFGHPEKYCLALEPRFIQIIKDYRPDVIHIFGTEYGHTLGVAKAVKRLKDEKFDKLPAVLVGIQGLISKCGEEYTAKLPKKTVKAKTLRDIVKKDNIANQQEKFLERGRMEVEAIGLIDNITGRTAYDREITNKYNPNATYYHMNETLRDNFYTGTWDIEECDRHTIFVSQADYPLKGFHILLEAMPTICEAFADARIKVSGANITQYSTLKQKIKLSGYGKYLRELIKKNNLEQKVEFLGKLNANEMKKEYLKCHVYVCPSSLENSPNSVGEAMILGVPVVASRTGGIPSLLEDNVEGFLFDTCDSASLAEQIIKIWSDDGLAMELSGQAINRACKTHNPDINYERLIQIYSQILGRE